ncbi:MAG: adenosylmethionine--8-amino-7-oxononanoate transaminase [Bacteroidia bacterium]|nr:adenosylmethionine--8-amino-7-oxononanoate transaminase [Bacteroidia bacterium]
MTEQSKTLQERDAELIWHPYTQHKASAMPLPIVKGEGVYLVDEKGNKYIDAISSWWTNLHGHAHPYIAQKIFEQAQQLEHVIFAGFTHRPAVQLAETILPLLPGHFSKVFYSDNGSTAVEVALKMAIQYQKNQYPNSKSQRTKILALRHSYHGDTFGAMSVSERGVFTMAFENYLFEVIFVDPDGESSIVDSKLDNIACFIYEPLLQGAGGMNMYEADVLNQLLKQCKQHNILCIADEVMTGFYRTGKMFASEYVEEKPDIICLSKGLTGGSLPLAITACTQNIFDAFLSDDLYKTFFHGHSYTANPIACAAALASLDLLLKKECIENIQYISENNRQFVNQLKESKKIIEPRSLGTILAFEFHSDKKEYLNKVKEETMIMALEKGVLIRPLGNTVYMMPPYCITPVQLQKVYSVIEFIIDKI